MVGLPDDANVAALIKWTREADRSMVVVCHGPAALMAAKGDEGSHPYAGYAMVAVPDSVDRQSPWIGYLPGVLPWFQCEELEAQGMALPELSMGMSGDFRAAVAEGATLLRLGTVLFGERPS